MKSTSLARTMGFLAASLLGFVATLLVAPEPAAAQCQVGRTAASQVGPTKGWLEMPLLKCGTPAEAWFDVATNPALADASRVEADFFRPGTGDGSLSGTPMGLTPQMLYYFRGHARMATGEILSSAILSFRTPAFSQVHAPECRYTDQQPGRLRDRDGIELNFLCNSHYFLGDVVFSVSRSPGMNDAKLAYRESFFGKGLPFDMPFGMFLAYDDYPDGATVYVRALVVNNAGHGESEIVPVTLKRP